MKLGDTVQLKAKPKAGAARIVLFYSDIQGGVRLDQELDGFRSWNVEDLKRCRAKGKKK